ncbi:MAG: hypothetical protein EBV06_03990 [Planctomycetia bacterium]|nr:hypothetical protein [Planctomycetia bacterium]
MLAVLTGLPLDATTLLYSGVAGGAMVLIALTLIFFVREKKKKPTEDGPSEDLSRYPALAPTTGRYRVTVRNQAVRVRLVIIASAGRNLLSKVDDVLEQAARGLGETALVDKPQIRIWPPQLSATGFAPTFFRLVKRPEPDGTPSRWILLAGPVRVGDDKILLGLALQADSASKLGAMPMNENQWADVLRIERV